MAQMLPALPMRFLLTPLREGRPGNSRSRKTRETNFYSRPCVRGDVNFQGFRLRTSYFYSRPCVRGDVRIQAGRKCWTDFYSRPCVRGD